MVNTEFVDPSSFCLVDRINAMQNTYTHWLCQALDIYEDSERNREINSLWDSWFIR